MIMESNRDGANDRAARDHRVQFYDTGAFLSEAVADFLADGLIAGDPLVVLATERHRDLFAERLRQDGHDWDAARRDRRLTWVDARSALETIMVGRVPDPQRFHDQIGGLIRASEAESGGFRVRAYGELVDLLWREGDADAALMLEDLWNDLARSHSFSLLCAYSRGNIYRESLGARYREVGSRHDRVLPHDGREPGANGG